MLAAQKKIKQPVEPKAHEVIEENTRALLTELSVVKRTYGTDVLTLSVVCRSIETLLKNSSIAEYLTRNHQATLAALRKAVEDSSQEREREATLLADDVSIVA